MRSSAVVPSCFRPIAQPDVGRSPALLQSLTPLRGIAALAVVIYHFSPIAYAGAGHPPEALARGYLAVDLFFLLSGFVLAHVHGDAFGRGVASVDLKAFFWARFARTYPVHLFALLLMLPAYGRDDAFSAAAFVHNLFLTQGPWLGHMTWNDVAWSISVEWHAYLVFPFLAAPLRQCSVASTICIGALGAGSIAAAVLAHGNDANITNGGLVLARCLPEFVIGFLLYRMHRAGWLAWLWRSDWASVICVGAILVLGSIHGTDLAIIAVLPALLMASVQNTGHCRTWLNLRPLRFLGEISYSLYMVHMRLGFAAASTMLILGFTDAPLIAAAAMLSARGFAILTSRCIEFPARSLLRRLVEIGQPRFDR